MLSVFLGRLLYLSLVRPLASLSVRGARVGAEGEGRRPALCGLVMTSGARWMRCHEVGNNLSFQLHLWKWRLLYDAYL